MSNLRLGDLCHLKQLLLLCFVVVVVVVVVMVVGEDLDHEHRTKANHHTQLSEEDISKMMTRR